MASPWQWWPSTDIARITGCPEAAVRSNWPLIAAALERRGIYDRDVCLGVIPTVTIESASTFAPVREAFWFDEEWRRTHLGYFPFYGRGCLQITGRENYAAAGLALGLDLVGNPDLALDPAISADVLAWYWATRGVPAKDGSRFWTLVDLCHEHDWRWVRAVVQGGDAGLDRLIALASALDAYAIPPEEPAVPDAKTATIATIAEDDVNFRADPGTSFDKLHAPLKQGSTVWLTDAPPVTAEGHTWRQVALGLVGYVAEEYLSNGVQGQNTGTAETVLPPSGFTFDPTTPTYFQRNPWTCSIGAVIWCLRASGIDVTPDEAYDAMVPTYVNSDLGLLDASGAGIVKVLREHWGISAYSISPVTFAQVAHLAGVYPLALGLHNWGMPGGHWSGVRGFDGTQITLANPGGTGPRFGQQALTREQFEARGPASVVVLTGKV